MRRKIMFMTLMAVFVTTVTLFPVGKGSTTQELRMSDSRGNKFALTSRNLPQTEAMSTCVEVPSTVASGNRVREATMTDCSRSFAKNYAIREAREKAGAALAPKCRERITRAEAEAICAAQGLRPGGGSVSSFVPLPGAGPIDAWIFARSTNAPICMVVRDQKDKFKSTTQGDLICPFDGFKRTIFTASSRARCGVRCT